MRALFSKRAAALACCIRTKIAELLKLANSYQLTTGTRKLVLCMNFIFDLLGKVRQPGILPPAWYEEKALAWPREAHCLSSDIATHTQEFLIHISVESSCECLSRKTNHEFRGGDVQGLMKISETVFCCGFDEFHSCRSPDSALQMSVEIAAFEFLSVRVQVEDVEPVCCARDSFPSCGRVRNLTLLLLCCILCQDAFPLG